MAAEKGKRYIMKKMRKENVREMKECISIIQKRLCDMFTEILLHEASLMIRHMVVKGCVD